MEIARPKRNDPPGRLPWRIIGRSSLTARRPRDAPYVTCYAAAFAPVGTEATVFRICEAIW